MLLSITLCYPLIFLLIFLLYCFSLHVTATYHHVTTCAVHVIGYKMASKIMRAKSVVTFLFNKNSINRLTNTITRCCSSITPRREVNYPPVKPKYPPGIWGTMTPKRAWETHETRETLLRKPTAKWRLEEMAGELPGKIMWLVETVDPQPGTLPYKQYITKTHLQRNLPDVYNNATEDDILQRLAERVRSQVMDVVLLEEELCRNEPAVRSLYNHESVVPYLRERVAKQIMDVLINNVGYDVPHILEAQVHTVAVIKIVVDPAAG